MTERVRKILELAEPGDIYIDGICFDADIDEADLTEEELDELDRLGFDVSPLS